MIKKNFLNRMSEETKFDRIRKKIIQVRKKNEKFDSIKKDGEDKWRGVFIDSSTDEKIIVTNPIYHSQCDAVSGIQKIVRDEKNLAEKAVESY